MLFSRFETFPLVLFFSEILCLGPYDNLFALPAMSLQENYAVLDVCRFLDFDMIKGA
jgi:hypothetical protein